MSGRPACACTNISLMQLFHELKQKFPAVPDHVVSAVIVSHRHDKSAAEVTLAEEARAALRRRAGPAPNRAPPAACPHQPLAHIPGPRTHSILHETCPQPQQATIDDNQNEITPEKPVTLPSPVTVINLDNCIAKYCADSPNDTETDESKHTIPNTSNGTNEQEAFNYKILKSNKIKSNLNERLEKVKEKKTIDKSEEAESSQPKEKPKRPCTLDVKPDIAFKSSTESVSPPKSNNIQNSYWQDRGYPLNLSVNVNCHMNSWEDYDSPRGITSVNLTVCTPSSMDSPGDMHEDMGLTLTVTPTAPPRRAAPPPPSVTLDPPLRPQRSHNTMDSTKDRSLIERQKARLSQLREALEQERNRLSQLRRETAILAAPLADTQQLREDLANLREQCDSLLKQNDLNVSDGGFYSNIYTGQRPSTVPARPAPLPPTWTCHMCTFRNHPLLDKCEECEMPRILLGTSPQHTNQDSGFGSLPTEARNSACVQ